jgi:hypothetical protein
LFADCDNGSRRGASANTTDRAAADWEEDLRRCAIYKDRVVISVMYPVEFRVGAFNVTTDRGKDAVRLVWVRNGGGGQSRCNAGSSGRQASGSRDTFPRVTAHFAKTIM